MWTVFCLKWFLWSCTHPSRAGTSACKCGETASWGRATMATLTKPRADLTISRFLDCKKTVMVATSSEIVAVEIESEDKGSARSTPSIASKYAHP